MWRSTLPLIAPLALLVIMVAAVVWLDDTEPRADIVLIHRVDVFTLDPQRMSYQHDLRVAGALYEGLTSLDPDTAEVVPGVAERWEISEDGRRYVFHLRPDARWSNGDLVTSEDFLYAWRRVLLPDTACEYTGQLMVVRGAQEFFAWRTRQLKAFPGHFEDPVATEAAWKEACARFRTDVGLSAPDSRTFVVELAQPVAYFLDLCAFGVFSPVHRPTLLAHTRIDPATARIDEDREWTRPGTHITNGPYRLVQWRAKRDLRLEANEQYWNTAARRNNSIAILTVEDANTSVLLFQRGEADWHTDVIVDYRAELLNQRGLYDTRHADTIARKLASGEQIDRILAELPAPGRGERRDVHARPCFGTDFYSFNCRPRFSDGRVNPFADSRVRRAFALAVEKPALVTRITRLNEPVASTLVPPGSIPGYESPAGLGFDPEWAMRELNAAGWVDRDGDGVVEDESGQRFPTVEILYASGNRRYENLSLALRDMWRQTLGIPCEVRAREARARKDDLIGGRFMIASGGWYGDYGDPTTWLDLSRTGDGNNDRGYSNPVYDSLLAAAGTEMDPVERLKILSRAERMLVEEEIPILPLCQFVTIYMYRPEDLQGLSSHPRLEQRLDRLERVQRMKQMGRESS